MDHSRVAVSTPNECPNSETSATAADDTGSSGPARRGENCSSETSQSGGHRGAETTTLSENFSISRESRKCVHAVQTRTCIIHSFISTGADRTAWATECCQQRYTSRSLWRQIFTYSPAGFHNKEDSISCSHPGGPGVPWASSSPTEAISGTPHRQNTASQLVCVRDQGNSSHRESDTEPGRDPLHRSCK